MVYEYTRTEQILMAFITGMSNITYIPIILLCYRKKNVFIFLMAVFCMLTSILYHICESLDIIIILKQMKWHELDNICAICSLNSLILVLTHYYKDIETQNIMNYCSMFMTFVFQKRGPWDLTNTIMPIVIFILIAIANAVRNGLPKFNFDAMSYGGFYLVGAIAMFIKGLDDLNDYLRMYHSLWHVLIGLSTYYLWQLQDAVLLPMCRILKEEYTSIIINKQFDLI